MTVELRDTIPSPCEFAVEGVELEICWDPPATPSEPPTYIDLASESLDED